MRSRADAPPPPTRSAWGPGLLGNPHARNVALLFLLLLPVFFGRLSELPLPKWDDLTHAAMGKEILETGDWFTMHANGEPVWIKPPLYFWIEAALFSLFGASEYWARFPAALCGYLCAILVYLLSRRLFGRRTAFLAILVTATSFFFLKYSRRAMLDVPVACATTLGLYAIVRAEEKARFFLLYGLAVALGYYLKAVQGMYVALVGPLYLAVSGQARRLVNPWFLAANLGAAALIALWALPQAAANGTAFLESQSALGPLLYGGLSEAAPTKWFAPLLAPFQLAWPWIPASAYGLFFLARNRPGDRGTALLLCWTLGVLAVLCLPRTFFQRYLIPVVPALIIAAACALNLLLAGRRFSGVHRHAWAAVGAAVILVQLLPIPLDGPGTDQIGLFRNVRELTGRSDRIVLYRGSHWTVGQGLSFYADRRLERHFSDVEGLESYLDGARGAVYGIADAADFPELQRRLGARVVERAQPGGYVIFQSRPAPSPRP